MIKGKKTAFSQKRDGCFEHTAGKLTNDTRLRNPLYEELLPEQINDSQGQNYQEDTGANHCLTEVTGVIFLAVTVGLQLIEF